jgi:hypothetical protein
MSIHNRIGGVLVSMLTSNMVDQGFEPWLSQTKDYRISISIILVILRLSSVEYSKLMVLNATFNNISVISCRRHMVFLPPEKSTPGSIYHMVF